LPHVRVEDSVAVAAALDATGKGLGLADALHLLRAPEDAEFATFESLAAQLKCDIERAFGAMVE
jgi:hypothetical protein